MAFLQDLLDRSKQLNQTPAAQADLACHGPNKKYKYIHHRFVIPNLPAPLHYFNFFSMIGQPNVPMLCNPDAIHTDALDTATVICSTSPHMVGQLNHYSIQNECRFESCNFNFHTREQLSSIFPEFHFTRQDEELSVDLKIRAIELITHFTQLRFSLADYWSIPCWCEGVIQYKDQQYQIESLGSFEYARSFKFPYLPFAFLTYQMINLSQNRQVILVQVRDSFNKIIQSRIYYKDLESQQTQMLDEKVIFKVHRVYPSVTTPNGQKMYLPREFEWHCESKDGIQISIQGQSRGDFKFGLGAGYVGSFSYQVKINDQKENEEGGYIEYIDCRALRFQELSKEEKILSNVPDSVPFLVKR
ncbi:DUF6670 family protein [Acinetobacter schindleri]|uniref:DUF6670 family protein n=1 Tax=Acinetobacter schindleri TaxID=108981 RepID=UPI0032B5F00A